MENVTATQTKFQDAAMSAPRHEFYLPVHKGLRAFMCEALLNVGRMDSTDRQDVEEVLAQVRGLLHLCKAHLKHENHFVHTAMEARMPGSSAQTTDDHDGHEQAFKHLEQSIKQVENASMENAAQAITHLYRQLALFVAENFTHMHTEETINMQVLWACYRDDELLHIEHELVAAIPPEQNAIFLRWMLPYMTPAERAKLVSGIKQHAPAFVFDNVMGMLQKKLNAQEWQKLNLALDMVG